MQRSKKKKKEKEKNFMGRFPLVFLFPVTKKAEKVNAFVFSVRGEGKCEINYKKQKIYFCPFWELS